jgi:hypothetical protein
MSARSMMAVALATLAVGCSPDYSVQLELRSNPPEDAFVDETGIELMEGMAIVVLARPIEDGDERMDTDTPVDLSADRPNVRVDRVEEDDDGESTPIGDWEFVLSGASEGSASLEVWVDDELIDPIPVNIVEQPEP